MKLNLNDIRYIISESYKKLLAEAISIENAYQRFYSMIPERDYTAIIWALQPGNDNLEDETKWVLNLYKRKSPRLMEDLYKLHNEQGDGYLDIFKRAKVRRMLQGNQSDLNKYKSISDLGAFVSTLDVDGILGRTKGEQSNDVHSAKDDIKKLYEDDEWLVLIPLSHEADCYWGSNTHWCTAYRDDDEWFTHYSNKGPLYININKKTGEKYQFHFESDQFMDKMDKDIKTPVLKTIGANQGVINLYKNILEQYDDGMVALYRLIYQEWDEEEEYVVFRTPEDKFIIIDTYFNKQIYYEPLEYYSFEEGCIRIKCNGAWNLYNASGQRGIDDEIWYDYISEMKNERAVVKLKGLYNIIQYNGELLSDEWFKSVKCFETNWYDFEDIYIVQNDEKQYNILDVYGDLTLPYWVDNILETPQEDVAKIMKNGKFNVINHNGKVLFNEWFDEINLEFEKLASENGDFFAVCKDGKWNFYSEEIGLGSKIWFDEIRNVYDDIEEAKVYIDGNGYWFDPDFQILSGDENTERIDVSFEEDED